MPTIDCDVNPQEPRDLKLLEHRPGGKVEFDPAKIVLYQDAIQTNGGAVVGRQLIEQLRGRRKLANANLLDWLLEHPEMIPGALSEPRNSGMPTVFFLDTTYRLHGQFTVVRYLKCIVTPDGQKTWGSGADTLDNEWYDESWVVIFEEE